MGNWFGESPNDHMDDILDLENDRNVTTSIHTSSTMSTFKMSKVEQKSRDPGIQSGDLVLLRLPKGDIKSVKVDKNTCVFSTLYLR